MAHDSSLLILVLFFFPQRCSEWPAVWKALQLLLAPDAGCHVRHDFQPARVCSGSASSPLFIFFVLPTIVLHYPERLGLDEREHFIALELVNAPQVLELYEKDDPHNRATELLNEFSGRLG